MITIEQERRMLELFELVDEVGAVLANAEKKLLVPLDKWTALEVFELIDTEVLVRQALAALWPLHKRLLRKMGRKRVPVLARRRAKRAARRKERLQAVPTPSDNSGVA
jgi:hypothetical protein